MTSFEASKMIEALIAKRNTAHRSNEDYGKNALAGLAVKVMAQKSDIPYIIQNEEEFKRGVERLYRVFSSARQACLS